MSEKYLIPLLLIGSGMIGFSLNIRHTLSVENDLNASQARVISLENDLNSSQERVRQLELNDQQTIGDIIHIKQFNCAMMIDEENEPDTYEALPEESKFMCNALDNIELYPDQEGTYYFAPSSGVPR